MMTRETIAHELQELLSKVLKHNRFEISDALTAKEVEGWDSLSHMTLITAIEEKYGFRFKLKELNMMKTVGQLIDLIQQKCAV
jgi:acyl carrier protein